MKLLLISTAFLFCNLIYSQSEKACKDGIKYYDNYEFEKAIVELKACLENDLNNLKLLALIANSNYNIGKLQEAKKYNLLVLELDSLNRKAHLNLSKIYVQLGNIEMAFIEHQTLI